LYADIRLWLRDEGGGARHRAAGGNGRGAGADHAVRLHRSLDGDRDRQEEQHSGADSELHDGHGREDLHGHVFRGSGRGGTIQCTAHGRQKRSDKVKILNNKCNDHSTIVLHGTLDPSAGSITGRYSRSKHGKVKSGTFTLARGASPSGAFLDDPERSVP